MLRCTRKGSAAHQADPETEATEHCGVGYFQHQRKNFNSPPRRICKNQSTRGRGTGCSSIFPPYLFRASLPSQKKHVAKSISLHWLILDRSIVNSGNLNANLKGGTLRAQSRLMKCGSAHLLPPSPATPERGLVPFPSRPRANQGKPAAVPLESAAPPSLTLHLLCESTF